MKSWLFPKGELCRKGGKMKETKTLMGVGFKYEGSIDDELIICKKIDIRISKKIINAIKSEITRRSPLLMGACRDYPTKNSIGESLKMQGCSPQNLSYVIPLLIEEGFCVANDKKPFVITKK
jgi:hypothetical protein